MKKVNILIVGKGNHSSFIRSQTTHLTPRQLLLCARLLSGYAVTEVLYELYEVISERKLISGSFDYINYSILFSKPGWCIPVYKLLGGVIGHLQVIIPFDNYHFCYFKIAMIMVMCEMKHSSEHKFHKPGGGGRSMGTLWNFACAENEILLLLHWIMNFI